MQLSPTVHNLSSGRAVDNPAASPGPRGAPTFVEGPAPRMHFFHGFM